MLGYDVRLGDYVVLGNTVRLGNYVMLGYGVIVKSKVILNKTPLQIQGSRDLITVIGEDVQVGCIVMPKGKWLKLGSKLGIKNNYSKEEIKEYIKYIKIINKI